MSASPPEPSPRAATPAGAMILTLGLVSALCGLIIVAAYQSSYQAVAANRRVALERSVFKVVPAAASIVEYNALPGGGIQAAAAGSAPPGSVRFFAAYDAAGNLAGVAAEASARGYSDAVRILFSYEPGCQCITGIAVVAQRETPGIGDKVITDKAFLANFKALDARLNAELSRLANEIRTVKHGTKVNAWQIDAISGATITSRAVGKAINDSAQALLPALVPNLEKLRSKS